MMKLVHEEIDGENYLDWANAHFFRDHRRLNVDIIHCETQDEEMKLEHIKKVWDKYTCADVERLLP